MYYLRQGTSATVMLGPFTNGGGVFVDSLGTTLTQSVLILSKNGAAWVEKNETTTGSQRNFASLATGHYSVMLNATDTGSVGRLTISTLSLAALPVWHEFSVLPTSVFDYTFGTGIQQVGLGASAITSAAFDTTGVQRAANLLTVDMSSLSVTVQARSPVNALRALRNRVTSSGSILTIYAENDSTAVWTSALTVNASAGLIVESDPA